MTMPALLLANYWKPVAIAVAIAAALCYRAVLIHQRDAARAETASIAVQLADWKSAEAACENAVARQNLAVNALAAAAARESAAAKTREDNVAALAAATASNEARRANAILTAPIANDCASAIKWANAQAGELSKW
jgi:hypothetical protein